MNDKELKVITQRANSIAEQIGVSCRVTNAKTVDGLPVITTSECEKCTIALLKDKNVLAQMVLVLIAADTGLFETVPSAIMALGMGLSEDDTTIGSLLPVIGTLAAVGMNDAHKAQQLLEIAKAEMDITLLTVMQSSDMIQ